MARTPAATAMRPCARATSKRAFCRCCCLASPWPVGLFHALLLFNQGLLNVGQVVGYFGLLLMLDFPTFTSLWAYSQISLGLAGARRILELMNRENNLDQNVQGYAGPMQGEIEFRDVCFAYGDQRAARWMNVSFKVKPGQTVAIVGQTGIGQNLAGEAGQPHLRRDRRAGAGGWGGCARLEPGSLAAQHLDHRAGYLPVFTQHRRQHLPLANPAPAWKRSWRQRRRPRRMNLSTLFREGYQTVIGERGVTLSGGQRQRLALARAFLTDPRILILDDSTSAIDSATEDQIQRAIYAAARGRTTLIITHRLSQIRWADLIIVMRKGRIAAIGTHEDLLRTSEAYRRIFSE